MTMCGGIQSFSSIFSSQCKGRRCHGSAQTTFKKLDRQVNVMKKPISDKAKPFEIGRLVGHMTQNESRRLHLNVFTTCSALAYLQDNLDALITRAPPKFR